MGKIDWTKANKVHLDPARLLREDASLAIFNLDPKRKSNVRQEKIERSRKARLSAKLRAASEADKALAFVEATALAKASRDAFFVNQQRLLDENKLSR